MIRKLSDLLHDLVSDPTFVRRRAFLRSLPFCSGLSQYELGYLLQSLHARRYEAGEVVFVEGDIGRALFVVESGKVELSKLGADGKPQRIALVEPGMFFGEMALLEQLPRSASAVALERCGLLLLYRSKLDAILHRHPRIGVSMMSHLARLLSARLRKTSADLAGAWSAPSAEA